LREIEAVGLLYEKDGRDYIWVTFTEIPERELRVVGSNWFKVFDVMFCYIHRNPRKGIER
jgi:hypothetical protein